MLLKPSVTVSKRIWICTLSGLLALPVLGLAEEGTGFFPSSPSGIQSSRQRTEFTKENWFPNKELWEFGAKFRSVEFSGDEATGSSGFDRHQLIAYARYGLTHDLSLDVSLPVGIAEPDVGSSDSGLGNVEVGFQLRTHQNVTDYPFIIPHAELILETADAGSLMDDGGGGINFGISAGTRSSDMLTWVGDLGYAVRSNRKNSIQASASLIVEVNQRFSFIGETRISDEEEDESNVQVRFLGGLAYEWSRNLQFSLYGGSALHSAEGVTTMLKTSYAF